MITQFFALWLYKIYLDNLIQTPTFEPYRDIYGRYDSAQLGIGLGSPLSPLLAALYLEPMDRAMDRAMEKQMQKRGVCYVRFMDDWLVLAPSRWKLRRAITVINQILACLALAQHPDKTFIGRINRGFSFLGFRLEEQGLAGLAPKTAANARLTLGRLYEQRRRGQGPAAAVTQYQTHFKRWLSGGLMAAGERPEQYPNLLWEKQQLQILPFDGCG